MNNNEKKTEDLSDIEDNMKIADMNIEGMPWHLPGKSLYEDNENSYPPLSKKETLMLIFGALGAALLVGLIFLLVIALFILFCTNIWF